MRVSTSQSKLPGHGGCGTITIEYRLSPYNNEVSIAFHFLRFRKRDWGLSYHCELGLSRLDDHRYIACFTVVQLLGSVWGSRAGAPESWAAVPILPSLLGILRIRLQIRI